MFLFLRAERADPATRVDSFGPPLVASRSTGKFDAASMRVKR